MCFLTVLASAQINLQAFYDFGKDRHYATTTLEFFKADNIGNTFAFVDIDYANRNEKGVPISPSGAYFEIARCFNFWQRSKASFLSLQVEYNGGLGTINNMQYAFGINSAFLIGTDFFLHTSDLKNTFNLKVLYKKYLGLDTKVPLQFTAVWNLTDLFTLRGLCFSGFVDVYCEGDKVVILSEPQLWYKVGQWFKLPQFNVGGEVELAYNFAGLSGFEVRPCVGIKWVF